jgi:hypothetical protein
MRHFAVASLLLPFVAAAQNPPAPAKPAPKPAAAAPAKTWMNLPVGTDVRYRSTGADQCKMGGGTGSSDNADHELRIVVLGSEADGRLRLAVIDEAVPKDGGVPIVRGEFALLDPASGGLVRTDDADPDPLLARFSPIAGFPFPPLSAAEVKAKKPLRKDVRVDVNGEPQVLPLAITFATRKEGKSQVPVLVAELGTGQTVPIKLAGIAGMVAMAEGRMPKAGSIEPVDATVTALRREYSIDNKGSVLDVRTTSTTTAAAGKMTIEGTHSISQIGRRQLDAKTLPPFAAAIEEICAITNSRDGKEQRRQRAVALKESAAKLELAATVDRLIDSLTRDVLPPGIGR